MQQLLPERRRKVLQTLEKAKVQALAVTHLPNVRYLSGFTGSNALLLVSSHGATLITDPRYDLQARQQCDCPVRVATGPLAKHAAAEVLRRKITRLALESDRCSHAFWLQMQAETGRGVKLKPVTGIVERLRLVKSPDEIAAIRAAMECASVAFEKTWGRIKPGAFETGIAAELDYQMRRAGADAPAFETIVASGVNSAQPHVRPARRPVTPGLLLIDMGAQRDGFFSDMTRMLHVGPVSSEARRLYDAVSEAQRLAVAAVKPGVSAAAIDKVARTALRKRGLEKAFQHSTGHGLGLEIHEAPRLARDEETRLEAGMVITIEPGAYLEDFGGVRIEDTVVVTPTGAEILTSTSKDLLVI